MKNDNPLEAALSASPRPASALIGEIDALLDTQARLQFAKGGYDGVVAEQYGIALLDLMRRREMEIREAVAALAQSQEPVMSDAELLPCPFCGSPAERIDFGPGAAENEGGSCIACTRCQSSGPVEFGCKENFVSNWNRRPTGSRP